jgi:hypothetical protein
MTTAAMVTVLVAVLFGGSGGGGLMYWLLNRNGERAQVAKTVAETDQIRDQIRDERNVAVDQALAQWQQMAIEQTNTTYGQLREQCNDCSRRLSDAAVRITEQDHVIHEQDRMIHELQAAVRATVRALDQNDPAQIADAIEAARNHLN